MSILTGKDYPKQGELKEYLFVTNCPFIPNLELQQNINVLIPNKIFYFFDKPIEKKKKIKK